MAGIAWVNGKLVAPEEPAVAAIDPGFLYGEGLFETMRAYHGRVFRQARHLDRLLASAPEVGLTPPPREMMEKAIGEALAAGGMNNAVVRLTVTPGHGGLGASTVVVLVRALSLPAPERYSHGCRTVTVPAVHVSGAVLRRVKSLNYLDKVMAQRTAAWAKADEAILVDPDRGVAEGAMRNLFAAIGERLVTPPLSRGILPGVTREAVIELAKRGGAPCLERDITVEELRKADECFLTSSVAEILPVASVDGVALRGEVPGPVTRRLTEAYRAMVTDELGLGAVQAAAPP